ncbi:MAG: hypothetical protein K0R28_396 [Paenibacillus sp.]|jgi:hypothetical protein|nr:hypothetical protein [Paenibacillus sp.]
MRASENRQEVNVYAGTAKVDITPSESVPLIASGDARRVSQGVTRPLHARITVLRQGDGQEAVYTLFVSADILAFPNTCADRLRAAISARWPVRREAVILHATHTHSAPYPARHGYFAAIVDSALDTEFHHYVEMLEQAILGGIEQAMCQIVQVSIEHGVGRCTFSSFRRKQVDGKWTMAPDSTIAADPEVNVVRFRGPGDATLALFVNYSCHPTTTYDDFVSPDFPGTAMDRLEEQLSPGTVAMFLQGCCGDVRPGLIRDGKYYRGSDNDVCELAKQLSEEVVNVLQRPMRRIRPSSFHLSQRSIELPYQSVPAMHELQAMQHDTGMMGRWSRALLAHPTYMRSSERLELTYIGLAENLAFLALNGEAVGEYGRFVKERSAGTVIPIGYCNGLVGYIPTARQLEEGGYESYFFFYQHGRPSPYNAAIEEMIKQSMIQMIPEPNLHPTHAKE